MINPPGFIINGHHCSEFGLVMKSKTRQILPANNDVYVNLPGRDGSYLFPGGRGDIQDVLRCAHIETSLEALQAKKYQLAAWLHTTDRVIISYDDTPDKYLMGKAVGPINPDRFVTAQEFDLTLRCEPDTYGPEQSQVFVTDSAAIVNAGTNLTPPRFMVTFTAVASEWKVTLGSGKYIRVVHDFVANDTLEINCLTGAVLHNGVRAMNLFDWQNSRMDDYKLALGSNNLAITPVGKCNTTIYWTPRYL